jgi:FMN-dependent oxidoreductase (nitrilotriacetate monooxygenase family)
VVGACCALWDCWDEDTLVLDKEGGIQVDASKVRYANYVGKWVKTRGPLTIPRCPQGRPVLMQAGSSGRGRDFAARWAELIFCPQSNKADLLAFCADIRQRMVARGRHPDDCAIMPAITLVIGETESIAQERADFLESLIDPELVLAAQSSALGVDLASYTGDVPLEKARGTQGMQGSMDRLTSVMNRDGVDLKEAVKRAQRDLVVGTPKSIADQLQDLFESRACDGFVVSPAVYPGMFEQFCRMVVPELQRRGIFRKEYRGRTLRENIQSALRPTS